MQRIERISTEQLPAREKLAFWNDQAGAKVAPLSIKGFEDRQFGATLVARHFRKFAMMGISSSSAIVSTKQRAFEHGMLNLTIQTKGRARYEIDGIVSDLSPGDAVLYDPQRPIKAIYPEMMKLLILRLPVVDVEEKSPRLREMPGRKISAASGGGALLSNFLVNAWNQMSDEGEEAWVDFMGTAVWPLLDMAYASDLSPAAASLGLPPSHKRAPFEIVENNLCEPDLDTTMMADRLGVSARYVQRLFAGMGTTPSAYVRSRRLDLAARMLGDDHHRRSITEVSLDVGFQDLSTFCREFRNRFGTSPARFRTGALAD